MSDKVVNLPNDFIGKEDQARLESFGAHLIMHGAATRWNWSRENGFDVEFEVLRGGSEEELLFSIDRDQAHDVFRIKDAKGGVIDQGALDHVLAAGDSLARYARPDRPS